MICGCVSRKETGDKPAGEPFGGAGPPRLRDLVRDDVVLSAPTWVVKVGTSVLTGPDGTLDPARIGHLAEQICAVMDRDRGRLPWSARGAVGAGMGAFWLETPAGQLAPTSGCRSRRPVLH